MWFEQLPQHQRQSIDLHGFTVYAAEEELSLFLAGLPREVRAVEVTHGYSHGAAIKRMLRQDFYHYRVADTRVGLNPGVTYLMLK